MRGDPAERRNNPRPGRRLRQAKLFGLSEQNIWSSGFSSDGSEHSQRVYASCKILAGIQQ
jgi:hypothetical protein